MSFLKSIAMIFCSFLLISCATKEHLTEFCETPAIDRDPATAVEKGEYLGVSQVTGKLRLKEDDKLIDFASGPVSIDLKAPNLAFNPVKFFRGDRVVLIKTQNEEFKFKIPKELIFEDGKISVHQKSADQNAHLTIEEQIKLVNAYEENGTTSCTYSGFCITCGLGFDGKMNCGAKLSPMCSGSQKVLYKVELFDRNLRLKIYNDEGAADIGTSNKREIKKNIIKTLSSCG